MNRLKREYGYILIAYVTMQFLLVPGTWLLSLGFANLGLSGQNTNIIALSIWYPFSFLLTLFLSIYFLKDESLFRTKKKPDLFKVLKWTIIGVILVLVVQRLAIFAEVNIFGVEALSENTMNILALIKQAPIIIIVTVIIGPILEEIVFRKILFITFYKKYNFATAATISSLLFSIAHRELEHLFLYFAIGFTFSYLYVRTKTIVVPMLTHVLMNSLAILITILIQV